MSDLDRKPSLAGPDKILYSEVKCACGKTLHQYGHDFMENMTRTLVYPHLCPNPPVEVCPDHGFAYNPMSAHCPVCAGEFCQQCGERPHVEYGMCDQCIAAGMRGEL